MVVVGTWGCCCAAPCEKERRTAPWPRRVRGWLGFLVLFRFVQRKEGLLRRIAVPETLWHPRERETPGEWARGPKKAWGKGEAGGFTTRLLFIHLPLAWGLGLLKRHRKERWRS